VARRRWLNRALAVLIAALGAALLFDLARTPARSRVQDALIPELTTARVVELRIEHGRERVTLRRSGDEFSLSEPVFAPTDPGAVRELFDALALLAHRRRLSPDARPAAELGLDPPRAVLTLLLDSGAHVTLDLGAEVPTRGAWMRRRDSGEIFLVEAHAVRDLDRSAAELRQRRVFSLQRTAGATFTLSAGGPSSQSTPVPQVTLRGRPLALALPTGSARIDPSAAAQLAALLDELQLERFAAASAFSPTGGLRIAIEAGGKQEQLAELGACPGAPELRQVDTSIGAGCAASSALDAIAAIARRGRGLIDRRLIGAAVTSQVENVSISGPRGKVELDASGLGGAPVREWLAELDNAAGDPSEVIDADKLGEQVGGLALTRSGKESQRISLHRRSDSLGFAARRDQEAVALAIAGDAPALFFPPAYRFRSLVLITRDPVDLRAAARRASGKSERIERGELLDEWRVPTPAGASPDQAAIERLRAAVAPLTALRAVTDQAAPEHHLAPPLETIELSFDAIPGASKTEEVVLELGARSRTGCYARLAGDAVVFELDRARCAVLRGPWSSR
jgi:hypothetical protein